MKHFDFSEQEALTDSIDGYIVLRIVDRWRYDMSTVKISPKFQIVIPKAIRQKLNLRPGQKLRMMVWGNRIELLADLDLADMRGFLKGMDTRMDREEDRL